VKKIVRHKQSANLLFVLSLLHDAAVSSLMAIAAEIGPSPEFE